MAESKKKDPCRITLKNVRLSYPNIFTPRAFGRGEGKPAFSASALIPKDTKHGKALIDLCEDAIEAAKEKKWPGKGKDVKIKRANIAMSDGDDLNEDEDDVKPEQEGMMVVRARNYKRPMVLDENNDELREQDNIIYGGCYVDMIVTFWGQDYEGTKRMNCSLEGIRYRDEGEAFGAGPINPDEFDDGPDDKGGRSRSRDRDDDDDDRGSRRSSSRGRDKDDDDDDRGSRRGRGRDKDDDEDDKPSRSRRSRDDDEDDKPSRSRRSRDDDEDEKPSRSRRSRDDDDDDGDRRSSRRSRDDDEDEKPSRGRGRDKDDDDDDRRSSRRSRDDDDDRDNRSSRRGRDRDDDDDDRGSRRGRGRREDLS